jgi:hypothetical protein
MEQITFQIQRRNSPYNKYIRWFRVCFNQDGKEISSIGYKTEREARNFPDKITMPIGDRDVTYILTERKS